MSCFTPSHAFLFHINHHRQANDCVSLVIWKLFLLMSIFSFSDYKLNEDSMIDFVHLKLLSPALSTVPGMLLDPQ